MMRTRCPYCQATFRVKPEQLKVRQGQVRCGKCRRVFDGIRGLIEDGSGAAVALPPLPVTPPPAPTPAPLPPSPPPPPPAPPPALAPPPVPASPPVPPEDVAPLQQPIAVPAPTPEPEPEPEPAPAVIVSPPPTPAPVAEIEALPPAPPQEQATPAPPIPEAAALTSEEPLPLIPPASPEPVRETATSEFLPISADGSAPDQPQVEEIIIAVPLDENKDMDEEPIQFFEPMEPAEIPAAPAYSPPAPVEVTPEVVRFESPQEIIESITLKGVERLDAEPVPEPEEEPPPPLPAKSKAVSIARPLSRKPSREQEDAKDLEALSPPTIMDLHEDEPSSSRRWPWVLASLIAIIVLVAQTLLHYRTSIIANAPATRNAYVTVCAVLGCRLELPQEIDLISIDNSELSPDTKRPTTLHFSALLRNRSAHTQAWPHLELTLTDALERPVIRRVLAPAEYLASGDNPTAGFPRRGEQSVHLTLNLVDVAAVGYRLYVFYP